MDPTEKIHSGSQLGGYEEGEETSGISGKIRSDAQLGGYGGGKETFLASAETIRSGDEVNISGENPL